MWYRKYYQLTIDKTHGFGIQYKATANSDVYSEFDSVIHNKSDSAINYTFYEDDSFLTNIKNDPETTKALQYLLDFADKRWPRFNKKELAIMNRLVASGSCRFSPVQKDSLEAELSADEEHYRIRITPNKRSYGYVSSCSCGKLECIHAKAASVFCQRRINGLMHKHVITSHPVDKSLFLEPDLTDAVIALDCLDKPNHTLFQSIRSIINMIDAANSDEYYRLFYQYLLDLTPPYYSYEAHFLENYYSYLLLALFENPGFHRTVLLDGSYADPTGYEDRQAKSNRVCFKRMFKEYQKLIRDMDRKADYSPDIHKEALLKYRGDPAGLVRYYAEGKETFDESDLPYLEDIATAAAESENAASHSSQTDPSYSGESASPFRVQSIRAIAVKLDALSYNKRFADIFHMLIDGLPANQKVEIYSHLRNFTMPMEVIRSLPPDAQRRMINNSPLTSDNIGYIFDTVLDGDSPSDKGRFILRCVERSRFSGDTSLKKAIAEKASLLPDSRLLLAYVTHRLDIPSTWKAAEGNPRKELATYFTCDFEIENEQSSFCTVFTISDPESSAILLLVREGMGHGDVYREKKLQFENMSYSASLIREVCLSGREKEYESLIEKNRETVDAFLFEKNNKKFAGEYKKLCESLKDEEYLFTESAKAEIEWLIYTENGSCALAFKVGNTKKYVVKDAVEFIGAFKTGQTTKYGKDLILTHDTKNLNDSDAAAITILMTSRYRKGRKNDIKNKRYITIDQNMLGTLLELLTGRTIMYNDQPCELRMETVPVRLKIDRNCILSTDLDNDRQELLNLSGRGYAVSLHSSHMVMDRVMGSAEEINLIDLVNRNPSVSIRPIIGDFKKNIYARFFELFDVDKEVSRDFTLSTIRLNTYFDFERSVVTARTQILKEGKEIPVSAVHERIDLVKLEMLQTYLQSLGFTEGVLDEESRILAFFKLDFTRLKSLTNVYLSESLKNKEIRSVGKPVIRVTYRNNLVDVFLEHSEYSESELEQIIRGLRKKKKFILLDGDRIIDLDSEAARDLGDTVQDFGMDPKELFKKKRISMVTAIKAFSHERSCRIDKYLRDMIEAIRSFKEADITVPNLNGELRDYQTEGFKWMSILSEYGMGGILADDMGLGKTIQVIALIRADRTKKPSLVVCPKSLVVKLTYLKTRAS